MSDAKKLRVMSYQLSGVAWVPWRVGQCLKAAGDDVEFVTTGSEPSGMESYGLPLLQGFGRLDDLLRCHTPDIVLMHHDVAAQALVPFVRRMSPKVRVIITLHGEPDRSRNRVGINKPDAYHVVEPSLLDIPGVGAVLSRWIPNHPATIVEPVTHQAAAERVVYRPWSHVRSFKDWDALNAEEAMLASTGWKIEREQTIRPNDAVRRRLGQVMAAWVQRRGYLDLLTMEAMSLGALPIVELSGGRLAQWATALGFMPMIVNGWSLGGLSRRLAWAVDDGAAEANLLGMSERWTMAECGRRWAQFFNEVALR